MSESTSHKSLNIALGTAFAASMTFAGAASAATGANPFQVQEINTSSNYVQVAEGSCGSKKDAEGDCGGKKDSEGDCGAKKDGEGSCGGSA